MKTARNQLAASFSNILGKTVRAVALGVVAAGTFAAPATPAFSTTIPAAMTAAAACSAISSRFATPMHPPVLANQRLLRLRLHDETRRASCLRAARHDPAVSFGQRRHRQYVVGRQYDPDERLSARHPRMGAPPPRARLDRDGDHDRLRSHEPRHPSLLIITPRKSRGRSCPRPAPPTVATPRRPTARNYNCVASRARATEQRNQGALPSGLPSRGRAGGSEQRNRLRLCRHFG